VCSGTQYSGYAPRLTTSPTKHNPNSHSKIPSIREHITKYSSPATTVVLDTASVASTNIAALDQKAMVVRRRNEVPGEKSKKLCMYPLDLLEGPNSPSWQIDFTRHRQGPRESERSVVSDPIQRRWGTTKFIVKNFVKSRGRVAVPTLAPRRPQVRNDIYYSHWSYGNSLSYTATVTAAKTW
jgi:hypothetical protein